jgi:diaminohydroxyphosphoribosylaminopyrimidine deaminase / 5-amino-6-(5-phosphoribosylamino)uracil reductase
MTEPSRPNGFDPRLLSQALELATASTERTSPNPRVGCVIVKNGAIVGRGVTRVPGQAHAEVVAIESAGEHAKGADMYVTLEPCCHVGRTPPCTEAIKKAGIARVFVGSIDPNPLVCGEGIRYLKQHSIQTILIDDAECDRHFAPFRKYIQAKLPWVHLKVATTLDGQLATASGSSKWITGAAARLQAHRIRAQSDCVLVGIGTVFADDPLLDVRNVAGSPPRVVILDTQLRISLDRRCLKSGTLVFHGPDTDPEKRQRLMSEFGVETEEVELSETGRLNLVSVLRRLHDRQLVNVMVEGGGEVLSQFLTSGLADELSVFMAPKLFGMGQGWVKQTLANTADEAVLLENVKVERLGDDMYVRGRLRYES